ncbi:hypothetical protein K458DRAFT_403192 [Lentithecium fluviatile CBS 122367]|uniref:RING-type domain-containing protein n=1 Tax=Lentithecium fluviatile CBS 122367 TaxID=1168545 RepID=A0A6G1J6N6_9PLEO|nr:hypothetical protein K458DRAFT_403192 [Lentithecium fluviatile CBS 122367]
MEPLSAAPAFGLLSQFQANTGVSVPLVAAQNPLYVTDDDVLDLIDVLRIRNTTYGSTLVLCQSLHPLELTPFHHHFLSKNARFERTIAKTRDIADRAAIDDPCLLCKCRTQLDYLAWFKLAHDATLVPLTSTPHIDMRLAQNKDFQRRLRLVSRDICESLLPLLFEAASFDDAPMDEDNEADSNMDIIGHVLTQLTEDDARRDYRWSCEICYEEYATKVEPFFRLSTCGHIFGRKCLEKWVDGEAEMPTNARIVGRRSTSPS